MTKEERFQKLYTLPMQVLYDYALSCRIAEEEMRGKDKNTIINLLLSVTDISDDNINHLVNDYIYGNRITFTLWSLEKKLDNTDYKLIEALCGNTEETLINGFRNLNIMSVEKHDDRYELLYVYSRKYSYVNEEGRIDEIWELHRGCVWIGIDRSYFACISKHDKMTSCILSYLQKKLKVEIYQIKPPKSALVRCINIRFMSRITLQKPDGGKTIISKSDGFTNEQEAEINRIQKGRYDTSGTYFAKITDDTNATIKYNIKKGSIGIYKHLSTKELFSWTKQAISIILDEIEALKGKPSEQIYKELGLQIQWNSICSGHDKALNWFLTQAITIQSTNSSNQISLPPHAKRILSNPRLFTRLPRIYCEECGSYEIPLCAACGQALRLESGNLKCSCNSPISIICGEGHTSCHQDDWYIPTEKFKNVIMQNYQKAFQGLDARFNMCVMSGMLYISNEPYEYDPEIEILFCDVEEFQHSLKKDLDKCRNLAVKLKEKCSGGCSKGKIQKCTTSIQPICLPKLFWGILPGFRPQPHSGYEYGDVSGQIKVDGVSFEFKGIIKKNSENKRTTSLKNIDVLRNNYLLSTSIEGQEIIRQFVEQGLNDQRCQIIAVIAPQHFDNGLKGTLRFLARLGRKKVIFMELEEVAKIIAMNSQIAL